MKTRTSRTFPILLAAIGATVSVAAQDGATQDIVLSEFMANNRTSIVDEDGSHSDWIEIYNGGDAPVNLEGWSLTDVTTDLDKWVFPAVELSPGECLVVFASGKDRRDPASELHTNFRVEQDGEFLGLIGPGQTFATLYAPSFPRQVPHGTFGLTMEKSVERLVDDGADARILVTSRSSDRPSDWFDPKFDDSGWIQASTGIGYDRKEQPTLTDAIRTDVGDLMEGNNASIFVRIPFTVPSAAAIRYLRLLVQYDSGFRAYVNGEKVAERNVSPSTRHNLAALTPRTSGQALTHEEVPLELPPDVLRDGTNVLAVQAMNDDRRSPDFLFAPLLESVTPTAVDGDAKRYFAVPTPGFPNSDPLEGLSARPSFANPGQPFVEAITVEMASEAPDARIFYTTDGSTPDAGSTLYTEPLVLTATTTVKARVFEPGKLSSETVEHFYLSIHPAAADFQTDLPILIVDAARSPGETFTPITVAFVDNENGPNSLTSPFAFAGNAALKKRGSSSLGFPKNNFALEIRDEFQEDRAVELLGFPEEADWLLHGPYSDKALMRNELSYRWSNEIGRYATRSRYVEMYFKLGRSQLLTSHYHGVYVFMEKIKRDPNRVNIQRLLTTDNSEPEITGGYILKKDRLDPGDRGITTSRGHRLGLVEPKEREISNQQKSWILAHLNQFERALYSADFRDPVQGYAKYIDVDSFIDHHILVEITKNIDGYRLSTFLYKDRGEKIVMGPIWDYNLCLGNANYLQGWQPAGWYFPQLSPNDYPWYARLFQDRDFEARYRRRWAELRGGVFATERLFSTIDESAAILREPQARNFARWRVMGTYIWPNWFIARSWEQEIDWMKNTWLAERLRWMDSQLVPLPELSHPGGMVDRGFEVSIDVPAGTVFFTLNGPDPKTENDEIAPEAREYDGQPIVIGENTRVRARLLLGASTWSGLVEATYAVELLPLVVTEVMYNPAAAADGVFSRSSFEFLEVMNLGDREVSLEGVRFTGRLRFQFSEGRVPVLRPGELVVIARNEEALASRYDTNGMLLAGRYTGTMSNNRMTLTLEGPLGEQLLEFTYDDDWYPETDGGGPSLVVVNPRADRAAWNDPANWRVSLEPGGSPGRADENTPPAGLQVPGDLNQDGRLNITDAVGLLRVLFSSTAGPALPCGDGIESPGNLNLLDLNGDRGVNLTDAIFALNYLFGRGAAPVAGTGCTLLEGCAPAATCEAG
ncbi:MAG: CotH kinase family protein [Planctomycetota bacterium]|nr:CotH kinase family protein [Planctomycetota bacterium]